MGTVEGSITSAADVPELLLTIDGDEAVVANGNSMGWVPALPSSSQLSMKKR